MDKAESYIQPHAMTFIQPKPYQCIIWDQSMYNSEPIFLNGPGNCAGNNNMKYDASTPRTTYNMHDIDFDDKASAWACGDEVAIDFCNGDPGSDCLNG